MTVKPIAQIRPVYELADSRVRNPVMSFFRFISPVYFRLLGFRSVELRGAEKLAKAYQDFFEGRARLLIAFRHPYGDEPQLISYAINMTLVGEARKLGIRFPRNPHAHFMYGYEVPLWAGKFERWFLPRTGAVPVYHAKFDAASVERIRSLVKDGDYPVALAPEGQVSYTSEGLPRIEPGAARMGIWCAEDLRKERREEDVLILPISVHHRWDGSAEKGLDRIILSAEKECGLTAPGGAGRFERLCAIAGKALELAERHYSEFFGAALPAREGMTRNERLAGVIEAALSTAERALHIEPDGDAIRRVYKIRQTGWDRIFRADVPDIGSLSPLEKAMADRLAGEAWYASRHMELVDFSYYLDFDRLKADDPLELYIETAQNYHDFVSRLQGGNFSNRLYVPGKRAIVVVGEPISVNRDPESLKNRKLMTEILTEALRTAFLLCIGEIRRERRSSPTGS